MSTSGQQIIQVEGGERTKIFHRVPRIFRRNESNKDCYDPLVVSIGPYHHLNPELAEMQSLKSEVVDQFAKESRTTREALYNKVAGLATSTRKCYDEGSTIIFNDNKFTEMMLLDGCFILQFIFYFLKDPENLKLNNRVAAYFVKRDLFLLENQLPFEVLTSLMSLSPDRETRQKLVLDFMDEVRGLPIRKGRDMKKQNGLDGNHQPIHLLDLFHTLFIEERGLGDNPPAVDGDQWYSYRSVMELKTVGIYFMPSKKDLFTDVQYKETIWGGTLTLPPIVVDDSTKSLLLNLLAYEACPESSEGLWVTSYICFLDSLIDHPEDVKELRKKGILLNILGSDQEVADLFNLIANFMVPNPKAYGKVKYSIEKHYKNAIKKWVAEWLHTHFSSPWTVLAFLGATVALVLTFIQTYKTFFPGN